MLDTSNLQMKLEKDVVNLNTESTTHGMMINQQIKLYKIIIIKELKRLVNQMKKLKMNYQKQKNRKDL